MPNLQLGPVGLGFGTPSQINYLSLEASHQIKTKLKGSPHTGGGAETPTHKAYPPSSA